MGSSTCTTNPTPLQPDGDCHFLCVALPISFLIIMTTGRKMEKTYKKGLTDKHLKELRSKGNGIMDLLMVRLAADRRRG